MGREKEKFIAAVAQKVQDHGAQFEEVLRDREGKNEKFAFLRNMDVGPASLAQIVREAEPLHSSSRNTTSISFVLIPVIVCHRHPQTLSPMK